MKVEIAVSVGELYDKLSILYIKSRRINDTKKLDNILKEREIVEEKVLDFESNFDFEKVVEIRHKFDDLMEVNEELWEIEEELRSMERRNIPDPQKVGAQLLVNTDPPDAQWAQDIDMFIRYARNVYITNDKRSAIKRDINEFVGSDIIEEKSY